MKITERMLEDWICENPEETLFELQIVGRQIRLPHGILDLLGHDDQHVLVIELKARALKDQDLAQVLRYTYDVRNGLYRVAEKMIKTGELPVNPRGTIRREIFDKFWYPRFEVHMDEGLWLRGDRIKPVLIGKSIESKTKFAARQANTDVYLWQYDETTGQFEIDYDASHWSERFHDQSQTHWANTLIQFIHSDCIEMTESYYDFQIRRLMGIKQERRGKNNEQGVIR